MQHVLRALATSESRGFVADPDHENYNQTRHVIEMLVLKGYVGSVGHEGAPAWFLSPSGRKNLSTFLPLKCEGWVFEPRPGVAVEERTVFELLVMLARNK